MRKMFGYRTCYCLIFILALFVPHQLRAQPSDSSLRLTGRVIDEAGQPVAKATVSWFPIEGLTGATRVHDVPLAQCESTPDGTFELVVTLDHPMLAEVDTATEGRLVVSRSDYGMEIFNVPLTRLLSDAPVECSLKSVTDREITILDEFGKPASDVGVAPANFKGHSLPFAIRNQLVARSDADGKAVLQGVDLRGLSHVYLQRDADTFERSAVSRVDEKLQAQLSPLRKLTGRVIPPDGESVDLEAITLVLLAGTDSHLYRFSVQSASEAKVNADGTFELSAVEGPVALASALPHEFPYTFDYHEIRNKINISTGPVELPLLKSVQIKGRVISNTTGEGIPDVYLNQLVSEGRPSVTTDDGRFTFWAAANQDQFLPLHRFGYYINESSMYDQPEVVPVDHVIELGSTILMQQSQAVGRVVNESGDGVAGAEVRVQFKKGIRTNTIRLFSMLNGTFRFNGVTPECAVELTARLASSATPQSISLQLTDDSNPVLMVTPQPTARYSGQIITSDGQSVPDAQVTIRKAVVSLREDSNGEFRYPQNLFDTERFLTDENGQFETTATLDWNQDTSIHVEANGFEPYYGNWKLRTLNANDAANSMEEANIRFGPIPLTPLPQSKTIRVSVIDENGNPIEHARVVFLGAKSRLVRGEAQTDGTAGFQLLDSPQIAAASADGYLPDVQQLNRLPDGTLQFQLRPDTSAPPDRTPTVAWSEDQFRGFAGELVGLVPEPAKNDRYFRKKNHFSAHSFAEPRKAIDQVKDDLLLKGEPLPKYVLDEIQAFSTAELIRLLPDVDLLYRVLICLELAQRSSSSNEQEQYISEALIAARRLEGDHQLVAISRVASMMLKFDLHEEAREILEATFSVHPVLSRLLELEQRNASHLEAGIARYFAPVYAIVDPAISLQLIERAAYANEIEYLKSQVLTFVAASGNPWQEWLEVIGKQNFQAAGVLAYCHKVKPLDPHLALEIATCLPDDADKVRFLYVVAETGSPSGSAARRLLGNLALKSIREAGPGHDDYHLSQLAADWAVLIRPADGSLAEQFLFESFWHCENENRVMPFNLISELARRLAKYDSALARTLISPSLENWSWMFTEDRAVNYELPQPLIALASIDPQEAIAKARQLFAEELPEKVSRQYAIINGIVSSWKKLESGQ